MQITHTTTTEQDAGLTFATARYNAANPGTTENPIAPLTEAEYAAMMFSKMLDSYSQQKAHADRAAILAAYKDYS